MTPKQTAQKLRHFLNDNSLTLSDLRKGMILILNGDMAGDLGDRKVKVEARKPVSSQPRASQPKTRMNIDPADAEHCLS